jgi:prepilin-type processing-associated H-X9-DG protein
LEGKVASGFQFKKFEMEWEGKGTKDQVEETTWTWSEGGTGDTADLGKDVLLSSFSINSAGLLPNADDDSFVLDGADQTASAHPGGVNAALHDGSVRLLGTSDALGVDLIVAGDGADRSGSDLALWQDHYGRTASDDGGHLLGTSDALAASDFFLI